MSEPYNLHERVLTWALWIIGASMLLAIPFVMIPYDWMDAIHRWLGLGPIPDAPVVRYLARDLSLMYAAMGAVLVAMAGDVRRYRTLVRLWCWLVIAVGVALTGIGISAGLPTYWIWMQGPPAIPTGVAMVWLSRHIRDPAAGASPRTH